MVAEMILMMYPYMDYVFPEWLKTLSKEQLYELEWRLRLVFEKCGDSRAVEIRKEVELEYERRPTC